VMSTAVAEGSDRKRHRHRRREGDDA